MVKGVKVWGITSTIFYTPEYKHISNVNGAETADVFSQKALFAVAAASVWAGKEGARGRHVYTLNDDLPSLFFLFYGGSKVKSLFPLTSTVLQLSGRSHMQSGRRLQQERTRATTM